MFHINFEFFLMKRSEGKMNKLTLLSLLCLVTASGCGYRQLEDATVQNRTGVLENAQRISQLEQRMDSLDRRLTTLSETTY